jgi:hypothetical protein
MSVKRTVDPRLISWRVKAKQAQPHAWTAFLRALKAKPLCENDHSMDCEMWEAFLEGWKRRARAWPLNTVSGALRKAIRGE